MFYNASCKQLRRYDKKNLIIKKILFYHENFFFLRNGHMCLISSWKDVGLDLACAVCISSL